MQVLTVINQKGGVGKSSTVNALGAYLHNNDYRVLYVDLDPQSNLSYSLGVDGRPITSLEVLTGTNTAKDAITETLQGDAIGASPNLAALDALITDTGKEYRLREALTPLEREYDFVLTDTPPQLGVSVINSLTAATGCIIPVQADIYSLQGIGQLSQTISAVKTYCNHDLSIMGVLLTRYNARAVISRDMLKLLEDVAKELDTVVFNAKIRECIAIKEAQAAKECIFKYAPISNAAIDYEAFSKEVLEAAKI